MHSTPSRREANLLAVLALELAGRMADAAARVSSMSAEGPAAIAALRLYPGCSVEELRRVLALSHPGTVRLVDRLQAAGLVERRAGRDRRSLALVATPAGDEAAAGILDARLAVVGDVLAPLDDDERRALEPLLERLVGALADDHAAARRVCRLCDVDVCGHPERCPITQAVR
jgi:MarR family transcriptional regulator, negative regulator of the multidrug operon emrRAB